VVNNLVKIYSNMTLIFNTRNGIGVQDVLLNIDVYALSQKAISLGLDYDYLE
jgi:hypothetical protein